jgi:hypothetical protein
MLESRSQRGGFVLCQRRCKNPIMPVEKFPSPCCKWCIPHQGVRRCGDLLRGKDVQEMEGLKRQGLSIQAISELTGYDRKTVRKYLLAPDGVPAYGRRKVKPGKRYTTGRAAADRRQTDWRNLSRRIRRAPVAGESSHEAEACCPFIRALILVSCCPRQSHLDRDMRTTSLREKRHKIKQRGFVFVSLKGVLSILCKRFSCLIDCRYLLAISAETSCHSPGIGSSGRGIHKGAAALLWGESAAGCVPAPLAGAQRAPAWGEPSRPGLKPKLRRIVR